MSGRLSPGRITGKQKLNHHAQENAEEIPSTSKYRLGISSRNGFVSLHDNLDGRIWTHDHAVPNKIWSARIWQNVRVFEQKVLLALFKATSFLSLPIGNQGKADSRLVRSICFTENESHPIIPESSFMPQRFNRVHSCGLHCRVKSKYDSDHHRDCEGQWN